MNYERITPKDLIEAINMPEQGDMTRFFLYAQRLWELENDIEKGKVIKLPCTIGDAVYYVEYFCNHKGCSKETQSYCCGCKEMCERERNKEKYLIVEKPFALRDLSQIGKKYFLDKTEAEQKLKELQG